MSRRTTSLLWRLPPLASHPTRGITRRFISQRRTANRPQPSHTTSTPPNASSAASQGPALESPATYTSIVSHASTPSTLTVDLSNHDRAKLDHAAGFFQTNAQFLYSAAQFRDHPYNEHVPEVVILGASNVGKSTFLNALVGRPGIARTSPKPGHTTLMNAFGVGPTPHIAGSSSSSSSSSQHKKKGTLPHKHSLIVMDTPGYGYRSQTTWGDTIVRYLGARKTLRGAIVLLSSEKRLMPEDRWLLEALADANVRTVVVITKADKVGGHNRDKTLDWATACAAKAADVRLELQRIQKGTGRDWKEDDGWSSDVFVTAAGLSQAGKASNKAGLGGVRAAILEMAGFQVEDAVEQQPENIAYTGKIVSFDDIVWKS